MHTLYAGWQHVTRTSQNPAARVDAVKRLTVRPLLDCHWGFPDRRSAFAFAVAPAADDARSAEALYSLEQAEDCDTTVSGLPRRAVEEPNLEIVCMLNTTVACLQTDPFRRR